MRHRSGFTLIEILVVLILMGLVAVLVAPALFPRHHDQSALNALLVSAREVAARRGEVVYLHIDPTGEWRVEAGGGPRQSPLATGRGAPFFIAAVTVLLAPPGRRRLDLRGAAGGGGEVVGPLT